MVYEVLDWFFVIFHSLLIAFNLLGWIWNGTRKANLITLLLTGGSWTVLGIFYGLGYCPLTDWHWSVLAKLGKYPTTTSYIAYLFERVLTVKISDDLANTITTYAYLGALCISVLVNLKGMRKK